MLPAAQKTADVPTCPDTEASRERVSSHQTDTPALWSHRHITKLPTETLSHIFGCLDCDDMVQVNDTCQLFRSVVQARHTEALVYRQLPQVFRKQFLLSRSWLKQMVNDGLYPFTTSLSVRESEFLNAEQQAAVLCFDTLGKMMSAPGYRPLKVITDTAAVRNTSVLYAAASSDLLIYLPHHDKVLLLGQNNSGSWSAQRIEQGRCVDVGHPLPFADYFEGSFSTNGRYLSLFRFSDPIHIYKRDSGAWQLVNRQRVETADWFRVSPSGKYLVVSTPTGIESIRRCDDQECWNPMPLAEDIRINTRIKWVKFSSSEQHLAIKCKKKLVILSLDSRGCWNSTWETTLGRRNELRRVRFSSSEQHAALRYSRKVMVLSLNRQGCWNLTWKNGSSQGVKYVKFGPSGIWLLITYSSSTTCDGFTEMIKLNPAGKCLSRQIISSQNIKLTFSPGRNFLFGLIGGAQYLLWGLCKSGQWLPYGDLKAPRTQLWRELHETMLKPDTITFSSCDNYLFTSTWYGAVKIWGQDEQGSWVVRGSEQCDSEVDFVRFSRSGVHALAVCWREGIRIWGRDEGGLWSVKGIIPTTGIVLNALFHPTAEHLILVWIGEEIQVWEIRRDLEPEAGQMQGDTIF